MQRMVVCGAGGHGFDPSNIQVFLLLLVQGGRKKNRTISEKLHFLAFPSRKRYKSCNDIYGRTWNEFKVWDKKYP